MLAEMILDRERKRKSSARQAAELMTSVAADGETVPYAARLDVPPMTALEVREGAAITVRGSLCIGGLWLDAGARLNGSGKVMIEPNGSVKFRTLDTISPGIGFVAPKGYSVVTNLTASSPNISVAKTGAAATVPATPSYAATALPEGWREATYAEATGSAFVDTLYTAASNTVVVFKGAFAAPAGAGTRLFSDYLSGTNNACQLVEGTHYSVSYANNSGPGVGRATVTGLTDYYTGRVVVNFTIAGEEPAVPDEPEVVIPAGYRRVEYVDSSGCAYIDTLVVPTTTTRASFKAALLEMSGSYNRIIWSYIDENTDAFRLIVNGTSSSRFYLSACSRAGMSSEAVLTSAVGDLLEGTFAHGGYSINGVAGQITTARGNASSKTIQLFDSRNACKVRIYYCVIEDGGVTNRNFVACRRTSTGEVGFYETVNGVFYANAAPSLAVAEKAVVPSGPLFREVRFSGGKAHVAFDYVGSGLVAAEKAPDSARAEPKAKGTAKVQGFSIRGSDGKWHFADAEIEGDEVVVSAAGVDQPDAVRYAYRASTLGQADLYNREGLPASPFASDGGE